MFENLPTGNLHRAASEIRDSTIQAIIGCATGARGLYSLTLDTINFTRSLVELESQKADPHAIFVRPGAVFVCWQKELVVLNSHTGRKIGSAPLAGLTHQHGRFFTRQEGLDRQWFAVSFDGTGGRWDCVYQEGGSREPLLAIIETAGIEGPSGITAKGQLLSLDRNQYRAVQYPQPCYHFTVDRISRDGRRIMIGQAFSGRAQVVVDLKSLAVRSVESSRAAHSLVEPALHASALAIKLRHRFRAIGVESPGRLVLVSRRHTYWPLELNAAGKLSLSTSPQTVAPLELRSFELAADGGRYELSVAGFPDGSTATLDSRGLLHLRSSDRSIPECTIVLVEGPTSGWTSDKLYWGAEYFIGDRPATSDRVIDETILRPFVERGTMIVTLRMVCTRSPQRPTAAWFVNGASAESWLAELTQWNTSLATARLYVVADHAREQSICGVLVLGAAPQHAAYSPRVFPYGIAGGRLYLPVEARLDPPIRDDELGALLDDSLGDGPHVWHPQAGLIHLASESALKVSDLLAAPPARQRTWSAVPGVMLNNRLLSIEPEVSLSFQDVLEQGRGDIASQSPDLSQLPPAPSEPTEGTAADIARALQSWLPQAVRWLMSRVPHTGSRRTWVNKLEDWATRRLGQIGSSLEAARHREVLRLIELLRKEPEAGLRFALPMGGEGYRGLANPSDRLSARDVDFDLKSLGGGRPADFWNLPLEYRQQLIARYRELAARELALDRHRRAAYIFAALLGDLTPAAAALASGGHWREAAVLYDERLHQPAEAARCLRQGGLWAEAITLYERLGQHEAVGDLHRELAQPEQAAAAWQQAVEQCLKSADCLSAARILEYKLADPAAAYHRLVEAWPRHRQAEKSLAAAFSLLGRHAWHERAAALIADLPARTPPGSLSRLVNELCLQTRSYPDHDVTALAADRVRLLVADHLETATSAEDLALAQSIARLVPEDRLLARDAQRYIRQRRRVEPKARAKATGRILRDREFHLPALEWTAAIEVDRGFVLAGYLDDQVTVLRAGWDIPGGLQHPPVSWKAPIQRSGAPILLAADEFASQSLQVHVLGSNESLSSHQLESPDPAADTLTIGPHRGLSASCVAMTYSGQAALHVADYRADHSIVVNAYMSNNAQLVGLVALDLKTLLKNPRLDPPLPMLVRENKIFLGIDNRLVIAGTRRGIETLEMPDLVTQLVGSAPHSRTRVAVALDKGGIVLWGDTATAARSPFATDMHAPKIALTLGGWLVAANKDEVEVYGARDGQVRLYARAANPMGPTLAVLNTGHANQFGIVGASGRVAVWRIVE